MGNILIIDADASHQGLLTTLAMHLGHKASVADSIRKGRELFASDTFDVILLDVTLPDGDGLKLLPVLLDIPAPPEVIVITGQGDAESAEASIRMGAWDYVRKPATAGEFLTHIQRALEYRSQKLADARTIEFSRETIVGDSPALKRCLELSAQAAGSEANVLILGETGTGKELFARSLHHNSPRKNGPFVVVDCAAIPDNLVESLLFGFEKGTFTGAERARTGLISQADGGSLFLDEVGELPLELQKAFLRVLQEKTFRSIGSEEEISSDFRLIAATNRNLDEAVRLGRFRQDLLYRLKNFIIELPPLRVRLEDITPLARHALALLARRYGIEPKEVSPEFFVALKTFEWPGNVRELFSTLEIVMTANKGDPVLYPRHLPTHIRVQATLAAMPELAAGPDQAPSAHAARDHRPAPALGAGSLPLLAEYRSRAMDHAEKEYLQTLVSTIGANMQEAADAAGVSLSRLYALLRKHGIKKSF